MSGALLQLKGSFDKKGPSSKKGRSAFFVLLSAPHGRCSPEPSLAFASSRNSPFEAEVPRDYSQWINLFIHIVIER
jgi:hypothetical protein